MVTKAKKNEEKMASKRRGERKGVYINGWWGEMIERSTREIDVSSGSHRASNNRAMAVLLRLRRTPSRA